MNQLMDVDTALQLATQTSRDVDHYWGWAAYTLGTSGDPRALPALVAMLNDQEPEYWVYNEVLVGLYRQGEVGVEAALRGGAASRSEKHRLWFEVGVSEWWVEGADVDAILWRHAADPSLSSFIEDLRSRLWLLPRVQDAVVPQRTGATLAVDHSPDWDAVLARSRSTSAQARSSAVPLLEQLAPTHDRAFHRLVQLMMERDLYVMGLAAEALLHLGPPGLAAVLKAYASCEEEAFEERLWMPIQDSVPGDLRAALVHQRDRSPDPEVREAARDVMDLVAHMFTTPELEESARPVIEGAPHRDS